MPMTYRSPVKMAGRRATTIDALSTYDDLFHRMALNIAGGRVRLSDALLLYVVRKQKLLRASYYAQRYGRPFYAPGTTI